MDKKTIVVIGNGMVGHRFCEKIVGKTDKFNIMVFGDEPRRAYDRVHLSDYVKKKDVDDLYLCKSDWYVRQNIKLYLNDPVKSINRTTKTIQSSNGVVIEYDFLVLATGSKAFVPNIPGVEKEGVFVYRTIEDLDLIKSYSVSVHQGVVLGGGLLGLEAAKAMMDLGIPSVAVIEAAPRLMPRQIDRGGSEILRRRLEQFGLSVYADRRAYRIEGDGSIRELRFDDGSVIKADMLIISAGICPRDELARECGIDVGERGGIVVDEYMQTSDPSVFAIGECALFEDTIYGLVAPGYEMADVAAARICEEGKIFRRFDMSTRLKLVGVEVASFGDPFMEAPYARTIVFEDKNDGIYKRLNVSNDGKYLLGGILVGDARDYNLLLQTVNNRLELPDSPGDLIMHTKEPIGTADGAGLSALPDNALICSCEGVTKGEICRAVMEAGCENADSVRQCTKAGSGCGGCIPMVKDLVVAAMKQQGKYIRNVVCEHFSLSRQELYDLIKIHRLESYDEVLDALGQGDGCEVCKPLISSLLASIWNDMILRKGNDTAQDSNDRFLANIQKGGTYSVVPRIPGGEITPDRLVVIGEVAKKYGLYTKITGAQRIDMFGAYLDDLPLIWEELIAAGFESGHAYGKALRTVKSCVGSTWCRFGLHDSVSFAIQIEERYRGLRAPHKIKSAVSGCIRECAEAQSKDF